MDDHYGEVGIGLSKPNSLLPESGFDKRRNSLLRVSICRYIPALKHRPACLQILHRNLYVDIIIVHIEAGLTMPRCGILSVIQKISCFLKIGQSIIVMIYFTPGLQRTFPPE